MCEAGSNNNGKSREQKTTCWIIVTDLIQKNITEDTFIKNMDWPTEDKVDEIVGGIVTAYASCGFDTSGLKLKAILESFKDFGYTANLLVSCLFREPVEIGFYVRLFLKN